MKTSSTFSLMPKLKEECGILGIFTKSERLRNFVGGLKTLQHRGQEGAGIVWMDDKGLHQHKGIGLVSAVFDHFEQIEDSFCQAIGHVRYSTTGTSLLQEVQPFVIENAEKSVTIAHNGHLINHQQLAQKLQAKGTVLTTTSDTEVMIHLIAQDFHLSFQERCIAALQQVEGAYSILMMDREYLIACRDPYGFRPLVMGQKDGAVVFASESVALEQMQAQILREIVPGEMVVVSLEANTSRIQWRSIFPFQRQIPQPCIFEWMYFARPESVVFGKSVNQIRIRLGQRLAKMHPIDADIVIAIPDSGTPCALGYAQESGIPFAIGLTRNEAAHRSFIQPKQQQRNQLVASKFSVIDSVVSGKKVVVVDDSLVRGTTSRKIIQVIRQANAQEIHLRIGAPPMKYGCYYGVDTANQSMLLAHGRDVEQMKQYLGVDSLAFLSLEDLQTIEGDQTFCHACFTGKYVHSSLNQSDFLKISSNKSGFDA